MANTEASGNGKRSRRPGCGVIAAVILIGLVVAFCVLNQVPTVVAPLSRAYPLWVVLAACFAAGIVVGWVLRTIVAVRRGRVAKPAPETDRAG